MTSHLQPVLSQECVELQLHSPIYLLLHLILRTALPTETEKKQMKTFKMFYQPI